MNTTWKPTASVATLEVRAAMLRAIREYFVATQALEVDTPTLSAAAVTDVHLASVEATAVGQRRYLHTSPEYAMKRLLAAGCGDIWQMCKVYRDGEHGRWHNPEFTLIEWYRVGVDHHALMSDVERLIGAALPASRYFDRAERLTYREAMQLHAGVDALPVGGGGAGSAGGAGAGGLGGGLPVAGESPAPEFPPEPPPQAAVSSAARTREVARAGRDHVFAIA